jgi:hypothetical protein
MSVGVDQILVVLSVMSSFFEKESVQNTHDTWVCDGGIPPTLGCMCSPLSWDSCALCSSCVPSSCNTGVDITSNLAEPLQENRSSGRVVNPPGWLKAYKVY